MAKKKLQTLTSTQMFSPVSDVKNGVIALKDGSYVKLMEFAPINFELRSPSEQNMIIDTFGSALRTMPRNMHIKITSTPSDVTPFIDDLERCMKAESSEKCRELQADQIDMIKRISETQGVSRKFYLSFPYEAQGGLTKSPSLDDIRRSLNRQARSIASSMEACGNSVLSSDDRDYILDALYGTMCKGASMSMPYEFRKEDVLQNYYEQLGVRVDPEDIPVNNFISPLSMDFSLSPKYIKIDDVYVMYCFLPQNAYPLRAVGGWLQILFGYLDDVDVDMWIQKEDINKIQRSLQFQLKNNRIKEKHTDDISQDYDDIVSALQSGYYIKDALASGDDFCYISTMLTIYGTSPEDLNAKYHEMKDHCTRNDMSLRICYFQQQEGYKACIPVSPYCKSIFKKSKRNVMATQLGSCYPFTAYELNDKGGIFLGVNARYGSPVFINQFDTSKYQNANMMIFGPSGSGKTYTLLSMLLRMRQKGLQIFIIAPLKGFEFYRACTAIGGQYIRIAPGSDQNINIMEIRKVDKADSTLIDDMGENTSGSILTDKIQQLLRFFSMLVPDITVAETQILDECMVRTYAKFKITPKNKSLLDPSSPTGYKPMPTLADLHEELGNAGDDARRLYTILNRYVSGSARSFSMQTNVNLDNKFVVLDVSDLTAEMLPVGMFIALDYVLDKAKADRTKRKVIAIDEMWRLMKASKQSSEFVVETFKIIRGYAGAAIGATQDLDDVLKSEYGAAIVNNSRLKLLLPMDKRESSAVSSVIDLTEEELSQIRKNSTKMSKSGKRKALMVANTNHVFITIEASKRA